VAGDPLPAIDQLKGHRRPDATPTYPRLDRSGQPWAATR